MSMIHQIYCTHCTHGSSALERREGELRDRMLGYSARAGSLEARDLRRYYRQIERYVSYYLPRDTPSEEKLRLTASSAPRRLVYHPSAGGLSVIGQVCYRQTDTEGRPGSYFAHVLFREEKGTEPPWSQLDCLKLWGATGWVEEDSPQIPFLLQPLDSLDQMLERRRPAVDDHVFLSFLRTPADGSFDDPAGVIPERWRRMDAARRCGLFVEAFRGFLFLENTGARRESLLLAIEPSAAALVFYGIIRLLPAGGIRALCSFSTFEPNADRVGTSLAATSFYDPRKTDLRPDAYRSRGFALNTFSNRRSESRQPDAQYARTMVRRLLEQGWEAVDWSLASLQSAGARSPEDLNRLAAVDSLVPALFDPRQTHLDDHWRRSPMAANYLRQALARQLAGLANTSASLGPIVGRPAHLTMLELIATEPEVPGTRAAAEFLLGRLPGEKIAHLLKLDAVSSGAKVYVLVRYVSAHTQLPPGCDYLWNEPARAAGAADPLLPQVLARLDLNTLEQFYRRVAPQHSAPFLMSLLATCRYEQSTRAGLAQIVRAMDARALLSLFRTHGSAFFKEYPADEPALGARLHEMVGSLAEHARQFPERLDVVLAGRHLLPDDDQDVVTAWANLRRAILDVDRLQAQKSGILRKLPVDELETACRQMAREAKKAMPPDRFDDDRTGSQKKSCLRQIGQRLSGGRPLLPAGIWQHDALWQKITWCFRDGQWPSSPLKNMAPKSWSLVRSWIIGVVVGLLLFVATITAFRAPNRREAGSDGIEETSSPQRPTAAQAAGGRESSQQALREAEQPDRGDDAAQKAAREREAAEQAAREPEAAGETAKEQTTGQPPDADMQEATHPEAEEAARPEVQEEADSQIAEEAAPSVAEPQVAASRPMQDQSIGDVRPEADTRQARAERFARDHAGKFFDEVPLTNGELAISADAMPVPTDGGELFLGNGVLHFEHAFYPFGAGFDAEPRSARHEVPQLAEVLGVPSVYVELQTRAAGSAVVLGLVPNSIPPDGEARLKEIVEGIEKNARMIRAQLRVYASERSTEQDKDEAFDRLVELTKTEIPSVPPKPIRRSEQYQEHPEAYETDFRAYNEAVLALKRAKARVIPKAKHAASTVDERKEEAEALFRQYEGQLRKHNEQGLAALREQCRRISVLVYQAVEGAEIPGTTAERAPVDGQAAMEAAPSETASSVDGRFKLDEKPAQGLKPPAIARIRPVVAAYRGRPLPPRFHEQIAIGCLIVEQDKNEFLLRTIEIRDIDSEKTTDLFEKTSAVRVRFEFFPRSDGQFDQQRRAAVAMASHVVERIEEGRQYTITLELSEEGLAWLLLLAREPDSGEP